MGYSAVGAGIVTFALFVMILVLLRIEKNTRPSGSENDEYDGTDKKLLFGIIGVGIVIALGIGWSFNQAFSSDEKFDPVAELRSTFASSIETETAAEEASPVTEEVAVPVTDVSNTAAEPATEDVTDKECFDANGHWICE